MYVVCMLAGECGVYECVCIFKHVCVSQSKCQTVCDIPSANPGILVN